MCFNQPLSEALQYKFQAELHFAKRVTYKLMKLYARNFRVSFFYIFLATKLRRFDEMALSAIID